MRVFALGIVAAVGLTIAGCATASSSNPPTPPSPPTPPAASLAVMAPKDGATVLGQPVTVSVSASNISDPTQLAVLLDGADITSRLSAPDANGLRSVSVQQPDINYGKNQVQVRYGNIRASSIFTLNTASSTGTLTASGAGTDAELAILQTRVLRPGADGTKATDWGIQVGTPSSTNQPIYSKTPVDENNNPCTLCYGFQIVMLDRQDLHVVSNYSYEVANSGQIGGGSQFLLALEAAGKGPSDGIDGVVSNPNDTPGCQPNGCIMVMQSLARIGYAACYNSSSDPNQLGTCPNYVNDSSTVNLVYWLTKLGTSGDVLYANGNSPYVGYSFVGNAGSGNMPGTGALGGNNNGIYNKTNGNENGQFERLGCLETTYNHSPSICDSLRRGGSSDNAGGSTDLQQAGRITGALIRDNYNLFTFAENAPQLAYTFGTTLSGGVYTNVISINGSTIEGAGQYTQSMPAGTTGGFRLLILNRTHPDWADAKQWNKFYSYPADLPALEQDILTFSNANGLFFLASMGDITHYGEIPSSVSTWEPLVEYLEVLGGQATTLRILGDNHPAFNPDKKDDYLLVGKIIPYAPPVVDNFGAGGQGRYTAQETGYVINRHTLANATSSTLSEGVLVADHQGYYTPHLSGQQQGIAVPQVASLSSASLLAPVAWPYTSNQSQQSAYTWISNQLCCADIRATYINLNASPAVWLTQIQQLTFPTDQSSNFSQSDFDDVKQQLATEFSYVQVTRNLQNNILSLYQDQQSNVGLILDQAASDVKADVFGTGTPPASAPTPWSTFTTDIFPVLSNLAGFLPEGSNVVKNALGIGTLVIDTATEHSNDPSGVSQVMHSLANEEIAEADLAQHVTNEYADSLGTLGNDFKRVVTDWGRLKTVGGPISTGQLVWDPTATSFFLRAFDLTTRRQFYPLLMRSNSEFFVTHIQYADYQYYGSNDHAFIDGCHQEHFHEAQDNTNNPGIDNSGEDLRGTAWWPGAVQVDPGYYESPHTPGAYWWDIWALGEGPDTDDKCPLPNFQQKPLPSTYGMFDAITGGDTTQTNGLGLWKPYILQSGTWPHTYLHPNNRGVGPTP